MPFYHDISFWRHSAALTSWAVFIVLAGHSLAAPLVHNHKEQQRQSSSDRGGGGRACGKHRVEVQFVRPWRKPLFT